MISERKIIFIDIDGTLRDDKKEISQINIEAVRKVKDAGYIIVLCTGRNIEHTIELQKVIGVGDYIVFNNGGGAYDCKANKTLYENVINNETSQRIKDLAINRNSNYIFKDFGSKIVVILNDYEEMKKFEAIINAMPKVKIENRHKKLIDPIFAVREGRTLYFDVVDEKSSKGNGVKFLCEMLAISNENRIAIGDSDNDISMFQEVGTAVAMANATNGLKAIATEITASNNDNGVALFLDKLIQS